MLEWSNMRDAVKWVQMFPDETAVMRDGRIFTMPNPGKDKRTNALLAGKATLPLGLKSEM